MEQGQEAKTVSWGTVLVIAGVVFAMLALASRTPALWLVAFVLFGAGAVTQFVGDRRKQ